MRKSIAVAFVATLITTGFGEPTRRSDFTSHAFAAVPPQPFLLQIGDVRAASGRVPRGFGKLGLSRDQKERIYGIQAAYAERVKELEAEIETLKEEQMTRVKGVLNDAQRIQVEKYELEAAAKKQAKAQE